MPVFVEDPAQFSKPRLKSELIAHNVTLPAVESKKQVYVELYLKHIVQKSAADFSSDEEDDDVVEVQDSQDFVSRDIMSIGWLANYFVSSSSSETLYKVYWIKATYVF